MRRRCNPKYVQKNKQVTVVRVNCPGCGRKRRRTSGRMVRERICGNIFQLCNDGPKIYFSTLASHPSATIQINNDTRSDMFVVMETRHGTSINGTVEQGQQVTFMVPYLSRLQIECNGEGGICKGSYMLKLRQWTNRGCQCGRTIRRYRL